MKTCSTTDLLGIDTRQVDGVGFNILLYTLQVISDMIFPAK